MSQTTALNRRIVSLERELRELREVHLKLRDKLLECAKQCMECGGTGLVTRQRDSLTGGSYEAECEDCLDIRTLLGE